MDKDQTKPNEPWQETGQRCGWTDTGVCAAKVAKACKWPHCTPKVRGTS